MEDLKVEITVGKPDFKDYRVMSDGMLRYHAQQGHPRRAEEINIFFKDKDGKVLGAVIGVVLWNGLDINSLWVDEKMRKKGLGTKLLLMIEEEGKKRGCTLAYTNTFTWQAPEFYEKNGYMQFGKIENFPPGNSLLYYLKQL